MAQKTIYVDDLDGSDAEGPVAFGLNGKDFIIDLSEKNRRRLEDFLVEFITNARPAQRRAVTNVKPARPTRDPAERGVSLAARAWCLGAGVGWVEQAGYPAPAESTRGRLAKKYVELYRKHGQQASDAAKS